MGWLAKDPVLWALYEAPDVPARLVSTLVAVAAHAGEDGRGAYPSGASIALMTRKSESQAKRDMAALEKLGLLLPGDQRAVAHIRADRRPKIYDLPIYRGASERPPSQDQRGASRRPPSRGSRGASGYRTGRSSLQSGGRLDAPEEFLKNSGTARQGARAGGARTGAFSHHPGYRAPPCPECGKPFSQEQLADPGFREMALAGEAMHDECGEASDVRYLLTTDAQQLIWDGAVEDAIKAGRDLAEFTALGYEP